mmetsp:Transcript_32855/g.82514  ORF Transcript_32855/g.82514 Transcript_32855/m.82514 type:complete len:224 (+) Transcript_32855:1722-2393(+)
MAAHKRLCLDELFNKGIEVHAVPGRQPDHGLHHRGRNLLQLVGHRRVAHLHEQLADFPALVVGRSRRALGVRRGQRGFEPVLHGNLGKLFQRQHYRYDIQAIKQIFWSEATVLGYTHVKHGLTKKDNVLLQLEPVACLLLDVWYGHWHDRVHKMTQHDSILQLFLEVVFYSNFQNLLNPLVYAVLCHKIRVNALFACRERHCARTQQHSTAVKIEGMSGSKAV